MSLLSFSKVVSFSLCLLSVLGMRGLDSDPTFGYREQRVRGNFPLSGDLTANSSVQETRSQSHTPAQQIRCCCHRSSCKGLIVQKTSSQDQAQGSCPLPHARGHMTRLLYNRGFVCLFPFLLSLRIYLFIYFILEPGDHGVGTRCVRFGNESS